MRPTLFKPLSEPYRNHKPLLNPISPLDPPAAKNHTNPTFSVVLEAGSYYLGSCGPLLSQDPILPWPGAPPRTTDSGFKKGCRVSGPNLKDPTAQNSLKPNPLNPHRET